MTEPRRSTVYDYTELRLHPDGTRVSQSLKNRQLKLARVTTQTSRKNWIASDAGGSGKVAKFRKKSKSGPTDQEAGEYFEGFSQSNDIEEHISEDDRESGQKKRRVKRFDGRPLKKRKFIANEQYLDEDDVSVTQSNEADQGRTENEPFGLPEPSPDLLKFIHHFASEFYTERGELLNITRQWRRERKERRRLKQKLAKEADSNELSSSESSSPSRSQPSSEFDSEGAVKEDEHSESKKDRTTSAALLEISRKRNDEVFVDMYKRLDGTAIMAFGMLIQEKIARQLTAPPPPGWADATKAQESRTASRTFSPPTKGADLGSDQEDNLSEDVQESLRSEDTQNSDSEADYR